MCVIDQVLSQNGKTFAKLLFYVLWTKLNVKFIKIEKKERDFQPFWRNKLGYM